MENQQDLVTIIIPAFNESGTIQDTVLALKSLKVVDQIIVVNDCSQDNTGDLAEAAGAEVYNLKRNVGKGGAINFGLEHAKGAIIGFIDGDLGKSAVEVEKLITPVLENKADMTIGKFPTAVKKGGFGLVNNLARKGIKWFTGLHVASPLSGQRVMLREILEKVGLMEARFGVEVGLTIDVLRLGYRVKEIPVQMTHAETGRDLAGFLHRGHQFYDVLTVLTKRLFMR